MGGGLETLDQVLANLSLLDFLAALQKEHIDTQSLRLLSEEDLKQLGIPLGGRRKIQEWQQEQSAAAGASLYTPAPIPSISDVSTIGTQTSETVTISLQDNVIFAGDEKRYLYADRFTKLEELKRLINEKWGWVTTLQAFVYNTNVLDDDNRTLAEYGIPPREWVLCHYQDQLRIIVHNMTTSPKQTFSLDILNWEPMEKVKQQMQQKTRVPWNNIKLYHRSEELKGKTLQGIPDGAELHMTVAQQPSAQSWAWK